MDRQIHPDDSSDSPKLDGLPVSKVGRAMKVDNKPISTLILYSNPSDTSKLRLDKDDRAMDDIVRELQSIREIRSIRRHATSTIDLVRLISKEDFEIIQFSGHGDTKGIFIEDPDREFGTLLSARLIEQILRGSSTQNLRILIFMSCYSAGMVDHLTACAPYIITVEGPADDKEAINFLKTFYWAYFNHRSVQKAFEEAKLELAVRQKGDLVKAVLISRARRSSEGRLVIEAEIAGIPDGFLIDLSNIEDSLDRLGLPQEEVIDLLARKIRMHQGIFALPRENAVLPIGILLIGYFTWNSSANYIKCNKLVRVSDDVDPNHWDAWMRLLINYNDLCAEKYRSPDMRPDPTTKTIVVRSLHRFQRAYKSMTTCVKQLADLGFKKVQLAYSTAGTYLEQAEQELAEDEVSSAVGYLESSLSSLHDAVNASMPKVV